MAEEKYIVMSAWQKETKINVDQILYIRIEKRVTMFHMYGGVVHPSRLTIEELEGMLGDDFLKANRNLLISVKAIHNITKQVNLINGESLKYVVTKKKEILEQFYQKRKNIICRLHDGNIPQTEEEYREHYRSFEQLPFAFTDIEMIFDEADHAIDWIFRYGNQALAKLEKLPLEDLIGHSFSSLFGNRMDTKWLRTYERVAFYGETLEIIDYSPEIDAYLRITCYPTFAGHCGCILHNIDEITFARENMDSDKALIRYLELLLEK